MQPHVKEDDVLCWNGEVYLTFFPPSREILIALEKGKIFEGMDVSVVFFARFAWHKRFSQRSLYKKMTASNCLKGCVPCRIWKTFEIYLLQLRDRKAFPSFSGGLLYLNLYEICLRLLPCKSFIF